MALRRQEKRTFAPGAQPSELAAGWRSAVESLASTWRSWLPFTLLIAGLTLWIYWPALRGGFIWDDNWYITTNPLMAGWMGLWKFWYRPGTWVEYYPIQETVQWAQWQLWGRETLGYHLTNIFLHITSALMVWRLLAKFGLRFAWLGGLIFAVHPVQVESVAYISELKNALSLPFFLLCLCAWIDFEETNQKADYQKALGFYLVAMLCKVSMAPFPIVMFLYAWWKRGRIGWSDARAAAPFFAIAVVLSLVTIWSGEVYTRANYGLTPETPLTGFLSRVDAAGLNSTFYFARCFFAPDVVYIYSQWPLHPHSLAEYLPGLGWLAVAFWLWMKRTTWGRHALLGLGFFFIFLAPFLGFITATYMNFIWVMDHFLYIPLIGLIGLVIAALSDLTSKISASVSALPAAFLTASAIALAWISHSFTGLYLNEGTFWTHVLERNPNVWLAHEDLSGYYIDQKRFPEAREHAEAAIALQPTYWDGYYNLGFSLDKLGRTAEAQVQYRKAIALNPLGLTSYLNLGDISARQGRFAEAEAIFKQGLKIAPDSAGLETDLGNALQASGRPAEAITLYQKALDANPDVAQLRFNFGNALSASGDLPGAMEQFQACVALDPTFAPAHENLGTTLARTGHFPEAIEQFEAALQIDPQVARVHDNFAYALIQSGRLSEAHEQFETALKINPADNNASAGLEKLQRYEMQQAMPSGK